MAERAPSARTAELEAQLARIKRQGAQLGLTDNEMAMTAEERDAMRAQREKEMASQLEAVRSGAIHPDQVQLDLEGGLREFKEDDVGDNEKLPVIDWEADPKEEVAQISGQYARPTWVWVKKQPPIELLLVGDTNLGLTIGAGGKVLEVYAQGEGPSNNVTQSHKLIWCVPGFDAKAKEKNTKLAIDSSVSESTIASLLQKRPCQLHFAGGELETPDRVVFDPKEAKTDAEGWPMLLAKDNQKPESFAFKFFDDQLINDMGQIGGVGLRLYFYLLQFLVKAFVVMAILATPSVIIAYKGTMYTHDEATHYKSTMAQTTLGNVAASDEELDASTFFGHSLWTLSLLEACGSLYLLYMVLRAHHEMKEIVDKVDEATVTMSDYTVMVQPKVDGGWTKYASKKKAKEADLLRDVEKALQGADEGAEIAELKDEDKLKKCIWVAWNDKERISLWTAKRAKLLKLEAALKTKDEADASIVDSLRFSLCGSPKPTVYDKLEELNQQLDNQDQAPSVPVYAFVTLSSGAVADKLVSAKTTVEVGGVPCRVHSAPEPESLLWQHLEYSHKNRRNRRVAMMSLTTTALIIGALVIVGANALKVGTSYVNYCGAVMGELVPPANQHVCPIDDAGDGDARESLFRLYKEMFTDMKGNPRVCIISAGEDQATCAANFASQVHPFCDPFDLISNGARGTAASKCHTVDSTGVLQAGGDADAMCYACICSYASVSATYLTEAQGALGEDYCAAFEEQESSATFWGLVATVVVVIINQVLRRGMMLTAPFAKSHTVEAQMISTSIRVFLAQVLNTAILMLLLRSEFGVFNDLPGTHYKTVNAKWYAEVGAPLIVTMAIQLLTPPAIQFVMVFVDKLKIWILSRSAKTQNQLNAAHQPREFLIAAGYGEILLVMAVTLIFGAGIPLLYHVAAVGFFIRYNADKWVVVSVTANPPLYSKALFDTFDEIFSILLVVHVILALYFFASAGGENPSGYITLPDACWGFFCHPHTFPMMVVCFGVVIGITGKFVSKLEYFENRAAEEEERRKKADIAKGHRRMENLPPFEDAYAQGLLINEDDDYGGPHIRSSVCTTCMHVPL